MRTIVDDNLDPYALRDALEAAVSAMGLVVHRMDLETSRRHADRIRTLERLRDSIRPRAEGVGTWHEKVGVGVVRVHHAMKVSHQCDPWGFDLWERVVWPDEAHDALELHMREAHAEEKAHVDIVLASPRVRRSHITTMRSDDG